MTLFPRNIIVLSLCLIVAGCATPTPIAQLAPTEPPATATVVPPTATALPPTATVTVEPTATSTSTPEPTATATATLTRTPTPTSTKVATVSATKAPTKTPTAPPSATKGSAPVSGAVPAGAPLNVAVQRTMDNLLELNKGINGVMVGASYTCEQFLSRYNAITQSPAYDVHQQSADVQAAYGYYRSAVDTIQTQLHELWRTCDRGGGVVDKLKWGEALRGLNTTIGMLDQAIKLLPAAPTAGTEPTATPKPAAAPVNMALSDLLMQTMDRLHLLGGHFDGAQLNLDTNFCGQFEPLYKTVITEVTLNQDGKPAAWIDSYGAYKVIIQYTQSKLYRAHEVCQAGGSSIGKSEFGEMRRAIDAAAVAAARAYDVLKNANALGQ